MFVQNKLQIKMKRILLYVTLVVFGAINLTNAQLADNSQVPNFTATDINGTSHTLYDYLDDGYTVFIDFSATWCGPCWSFHQSHALRDLYEKHGPTGLPGVLSNTTDDVMVFFCRGRCFYYISGSQRNNIQFARRLGYRHNLSYIR